MSARGVCEEDLRVISRFVDGELDVEELRVFESRLADEVELREAVDELRAMRAMFVDEVAPQPSNGFFQRVIGEVRRLPTADDLSAIDRQRTSSFEVACSRLLVAAALLVGIGLLVFGGLLRGADSGRLEASPDEVRAEMERIDSVIRDRGGEPR